MGQYLFFHGLKDKGIVPGMMVKSIQGRDVNRTYWVVDQDNTFVYLSDGYKFPAGKLKKKRRKHLLALGYPKDPEMKLLLFNKEKQKQKDQANIYVQQLIQDFFRDYLD